MADDNKRNLVFFEGQTMRGLYDTMEAWQLQNQRRLLSLNVQREGDGYSCIALTNPMEVFICDGNKYSDQANVSDGRLQVG
jgi:hypothetical protein